MTDDALAPDVRGPDTIRTRKRGIWLLKNPATNKGVFLVAARALAGCVSEERLGQGALLPDTSELRAVSARVAAAVVRHASERRIGRRFTDDEVERCVAAASWYPDYLPIVPA